MILRNILKKEDSTRLYADQHVPNETLLMRQFDSQ